MEQTRPPIYLNNAAGAWPKAPGVTDAVCRTLDAPPSLPDRATSHTDNVPADCRHMLTELLGTDDPACMVLTSHATQALNLAILGLDLPPGARVITSVAEHNSVLRPLAHLQEERGIHVTHIGLDDQGGLDRAAFLHALHDGAALVALNHVSNVTGRVFDVQTLFAVAKAADAVTLLDASQSIGRLPVSPAELGADLVAMTGHKGTRGPDGAAALYVAPHLRLKQVIVGGTGVRSDSLLHPEEMPLRLEAGTPNIPALAGFAAALRWTLREGPKAFRREVRLASALRAGLREIPGMRLIDDRRFTAYIGIVSFRLEGWEVEETGFVLGESFGIICRTGLHCAPLIHRALGTLPGGSVRFSVSSFTTEEEIALAIDAVRRMSR